MRAFVIAILAILALSVTPVRADPSSSATTSLAQIKDRIAASRPAPAGMIKVAEQVCYGKGGRFTCNGDKCCYNGKANWCCKLGQWCGEHLTCIWPR
ncbi:hypothetical protein [Xanthobacter sp. KR7-225]|uniref:hypothetical protein n=1 Tax=Xanthobacter sp. KR7-225 TaxID=3156613 RepID=UPI0032B605D2